MPAPIGVIAALHPSGGFDAALPGDVEIERPFADLVSRPSAATAA
jgi:hypothetical protein